MRSAPERRNKSATRTETTVKSVQARSRSVLAQSELIEQCAKAVPTNWCDSLLTGPGVGNLPARETEALLRGIQDRIRALKALLGEDT